MSEGGAPAAAEETIHNCSSHHQYRRDTSMPWFIWFVVSVGLASYSVAGHIASRPTSAEVTLNPGNVIELNVLRVAQDRLRMELIFEGALAQGPELGTWESSENPTRTGYLKFNRPGAAIRILASTEDTSPVIYEALPASSYSGSRVSRALTSNVSVEKGLWRWSAAPDETQLPLKPGFSKVKLEITSVEAPLADSTARLLIRPALGFKSTVPNVAWLWWSIAWPIFLVVQMFWAALLIGLPGRTDAPGPKDP